MRRIAAVALVVGMVSTGATAVADTGPGGGTHRVAAVPPTRHADAVAEAKKLLGRSPTTSGEVRVHVAPRKRLRRAPERPAIDQLVTRIRFWTSNQPLGPTFQALTAKAPVGMTLSGNGAEGKIGHPPSSKFAEFTLDRLPRTIASAELIVEVVHDGMGHSAVGSYAQVVPQPKRHRNEHVPLSLRTVTLEKINLSSGSVTKRRTVKGGRAHTLIRGFDALKVAPSGESSCPAFRTAIRATFQTRHHTWQAEYPSCDTVAVTRDGHELPDLEASSGFARHLRTDLR